jgi:hypothetical protein
MYDQFFQSSKGQAAANAAERRAIRYVDICAQSRNAAFPIRDGSGVAAAICGNSAGANCFSNQNSNYSV